MSSLLSALLPSDYPLSSFYFKVVLVATLGMTDTSFKEVSGIGSKMDVETVNEGGENRYEYQLPTTVKHNNLVLKRGVAKLTSPLVIWCKSVLEMNYVVPIVPMPVLVYLMNENKLPVRAWSFANTFPVNWEVEGFKSMGNEVAIEKIELSYSFTNRLI